MKRQALIMAMLLLFFLSSSRGRCSIFSEDDIERELKMLNKPYVISFKDNYGVVFDCVDIYKQPAFDHPLLKDHKLQITPSSGSSAGLTATGERCPNGTVPIRRTLKEDLVRGRAPSPVYKQMKDTGTINGLHSVRAVVGVYPLAVPAGAASVSQIRVVDERPINPTVVQSGWNVDPNLEGDGQSRFVVYWTADDYQHTGCANLLCPGFVVMNQAIAPGMALPMGTTVSIAIQKDASGNWLVFLNKEVVGYFPGPIVNNMDGGTQIQMGGTVFSPPLVSKSPPMGSGVPPAPGPYNGAAKFTWVSFHGSKTFTCKMYKDIANSSIYNWMVTSTSPDGPEGVALQYGGPGGA
uniref:Uncharacterized protein n=1 Tax=Avena sativa TaxID=4498 RepID=A0ACD5Z7P6_AVESA